MHASLQRRITVANCWATTRISVLDGNERYEDSYAITQEFREWIVCLNHHPDQLENSLLMFPNSFVDSIEKQKVDTSCLYERNEIKTLDSMLERTAKIFNRPNPISPTKTYKIIEYDKNEVFIHQPHLAYYYSNQLSHFLDKPET